MDLPSTLQRIVPSSSTRLTRRPKYTALRSQILMIHLLKKISCRKEGTLTHTLHSDSVPRHGGVHELRDFHGG